MGRGVTKEHQVRRAEGIVVEAIRAFLDKLANHRVEIYNEFSLQHELGIHLRESLGGFKVQFERNVSYFGFYKSGFSKREIDVAVFADEHQDRQAAIELKFPRNGQYPEQMFGFCKDVAFVEELVAAGFKEGYVLIIVDDSAFYDGKADEIYGYFRGGVELSGIVQKPTGKKDCTVRISGAYKVEWLPVRGNLRAALIEVPRSG